MAAARPGASAPAAAVEGDEEMADSATKQVFSQYVCRSITDRGIPHPGDVAEPSSLAWVPGGGRGGAAERGGRGSAVPLPPTSYPLWDSLPAELVQGGKLSTLQLEGVLYACTKHLQLLPSGERAGFFIGDGAGVGKGRQIAGVI
ncbi:Protein strawberry notch 2, partial [Tetrabaena socialis]